MIQREIRLTQPVTPCACGRRPHLIESRGNPNTAQLLDARALIKPQVHFHLECVPCGITTERMPNQGSAVRRWQTAQTQSLPNARATRAA